MPLVLLIIGVLFLTSAVRGTHQLLMATLKDDFTGSNNFIYWGLAVWAITSLGYIKPLKPLSNAFIVLVVLVIFLSNKGFFQKFMQQIGTSQNVSSGGGGILGDISSITGLNTSGLGSLGSSGSGLSGGSGLDSIFSNSGSGLTDGGDSDLLDLAADAG